MENKDVDARLNAGVDGTKADADDADATSSDKMKQVFIVKEELLLRIFDGSRGRSAVYLLPVLDCSF